MASADTPKDYCQFSSTVEGRNVQGELRYSPKTHLVHARLKMALPEAEIKQADRAFLIQIVHKSAWIERRHDFKTGAVKETLELSISHSLSSTALVDVCDYFVSSKKVTEVPHVFRAEKKYQSTECSVETSKFAGKVPARRFANDPAPVISVEFVRFEDDGLEYNENEEVLGQIDFSLDFSQELVGALEAGRDRMYQSFIDGQCRPLADEQ